MYIVFIYLFIFFYNIFYLDFVNSESGWLELLICMMYEYNIKDFFWKLYFDVFFEIVDLLMFWIE